MSSRLGFKDHLEPLSFAILQAKMREPANVRAMPGTSEWRSVQAKSVRDAEPGRTLFLGKADQRARP